MKMKKAHWIILFIFCILIGALIYALHVGTLTVTFYSDDGTVLKIDQVQRRKAAVPPMDAQMSYGNIFQSWDKDFSRVTKSLDVHPICENILEAQNAFAVTSAYGAKGDTVFVHVQLCGQVCLSGFDITINYDSDALTLESVFNEDGAVIYNDETPGTIRCNFVSVNNTEADVDIFTLKFTVNADSGAYPVTVDVNQVYALANQADLNSDEMITPEAKVVNGTVYVVS